MLLQASVIIPVHNSAPDLLDQLGALAQEVGSLPFEVLVVDNRSVDDPGRVVRQFEGCFASIRVVSAQHRAGAAYARNVGAANAKTPVLLFCDADDTVKTGWVTAMVSGLMSYEVAGGIADTSRVNSAEVLNWYGSSASHLGESRVPRIFDQWNVVASNSMAISALRFAELNGFDESFSQGAEDLDLCVRVQVRGFSVGLAEGGEIDYKLRESFSGMLRQQWNYGRSWSQLYCKHRDVTRLRWGLRSELRIWMRLLARTGEFLGSASRANLIRECVWNAGRLTGGAHRRRFVPL